MTTHTVREFDIEALLEDRYYCAGCVERVCAGLTALPGVSDSSCDPGTGTLSITFDAAVVAPSDLEDALRRLVAEATGSARHVVYRISGLD